MRFSVGDSIGVSEVRSDGSVIAFLRFGGSTMAPVPMPDWCSRRAFEEFAGLFVDAANSCLSVHEPVRDRVFAEDGA